MSRVIEILISPQGATQIETKGFAGSACRDASQFLETALGQRASEQLTSEYFASSVEQQQRSRQQS